MAPASKEGVTVADKEYLLGNKARELLKYTNQATKTVAEDISRKDVRQIFQKIAALDDIRDVQKVCSESIAYLDRTHREGFTKALYRCYGEDMRLIAKSIVRDIHAANGKMFQTEYEERLRLLGVVLDGRTASITTTRRRMRRTRTSARRNSLKRPECAPSARWSAH